MPEGSKAGKKESSSHGYWEELPSRLLASTIVASIVVLTPWVWAPFDRVAAVVSVFFESYNLHHREPLRSKLAQTAVVKIDEDRYRNIYAGTSPLNRCKLAEDLGKILRSPRVQEVKVEEEGGVPRKGTVAVDLDLSPTGSSEDTDKECQRALDTVIDRHAPQLILMEPSYDASEGKPLDREIAAWREARACKGVTFGHVYLEAKAGVVADFEPSINDKSAFGLLIAQRLGAASPSDLKGSVRPIAMRGTEALHDRGAALSPDDICDIDQPRVPCESPRTAIVGSGYTADDRYVTPAGPRDGVDLHAAIAACPHVGVSHWKHFLFDIFIGAFFFAPILDWFWHRYRKARERNPWLRQKGNPRAAYGWILGMFLVTPVLILFVTMASAHGLSVGLGQACAVGLVPAGVAVGMLIDAAVSKPFEQATHSHAAGAFDVHTVIKGAAFLVLLGLALNKVFHWGLTGSFLD